MKPYEHGGNVYDAGVYNPQVRDFSANINPLGLSDKIEKAITDNMKNLVHYPDPSGLQLKQVISVNYGIKTENVILGNGAVELMYIYFHSTMPRRVLIPVPSFSEYERAARAAKCQVEYMYLNKDCGFAVDVEKLTELLPDVDVVILGNPNNPTGNLLNIERVIQLLKAAARNNTTIIMDESFMDFRSDAQLYSVMDMVNEYDNLFVISSMTKFYAIPGLRLGFGVANRELIHLLELGKDPWNVNLLAQVAGVAALQDEGYRIKTRQQVRECINKMYKSLMQLSDLIVYEPSVNFILVSVEKTGLTSTTFVAKMKDKGFGVRDCSNYPGMDEFHVRFAVRLEGENSALLQAVRAVLQENRG